MKGSEKMTPLATAGSNDSQETIMADAINIGNERKLGLLTIPGVFVSLLPALACPLCWPAYAALLSSLGLGFLISSTYLLPLTGAFLAIALVGLGLQAKRSGYGPLLLGLVSVALILPGKFVLASSPFEYLGMGLLASASAWALVP
jgi:hypothetical protein